MNVIHLIIPILLLSPLTLTYAWDNHTLYSAVALSVLPEVKNLPDVTVESIESFLQAEKTGLVKLLDEEEDWARHAVLNYPFRPEKLRFDSSNETLEPSLLRLKFLSAIRVNPTIKLSLFIQEVPGFKSKPRPTLPAQEVTLLPDSLLHSENHFVSLTEGEKVDALSVISTASDEPDYGLDIHLWENNSTEFGKAYQFGNQPFGNPTLTFSSQAPFHMGFFHEASIAYKAAPYLSKTYPEYRIHMVMSLARYALKSGHPYWGLRFAGWGLHYIGDLTQPYHSTSLPGISLVKMLLLGGLDLIGIHQPVVNQVQLVTNEHLALENYVFQNMKRWLNQNNLNAIPLQSLKNIERDSRYTDYSSHYPREILTLEAYDLASTTHQTLQDTLPLKLVGDPTYLFGTTEPDINVLNIVESSGSEKSQKRMVSLMTELLGNLGSHSRNYIRAILAADVQ